MRTSTRSTSKRDQIMTCRRGAHAYRRADEGEIQLPSSDCSQSANAHEYALERRTRLNFGRYRSQHPPCLVNDQRLHPAQVKVRLVLSACQQPAWGADDNVGTLGQLLQLRLYRILGA
jgi:hypothetical protein